MDVQGFNQVKSLLGKDVVGTKDYDGVKLISSDGSWLMFRGSGTEPIMRVYAEAESLAKSRKLIGLGVNMILDLQK
jgi:phosphoglucomutase